jgi:asparagine synthase (glutamine-hydrolysing)
MSCDFFALLWDSSVPAEAEAAARINDELARFSERWVSSTSASGLHFRASDPAEAEHLLCPLPFGRGVVFGTLFARPHDDADGACSRCFVLDDAAARIVGSKGRDLIDRYWGHYVAFLVDDSRRTKYVLRSPACHQPCFLATYHGVRMYFSSVEDLAALRVFRPTINWDFVAAFCAFTRLSGRETGLNEISELGACEYHEISPGGTCRAGYHWDASDFARRQLTEDPQESTRRLRATVLSCVTTWAAQHPSIVQRLSGGLDSSILGTCLALGRSRSKVIFLNYYSHGAYGDERHYARAVSNATGFPLLEYRQDSARPMDQLLTFPRTHSPAAHLTRDGSDPREIELAREVGATARFTGIMGDTLFHMPPAAPSAADYVRAHGLGGCCLEIALRAAQMDRVSVWKILREAVTGALKPPTSFVPGDFGQPGQALLTSSASECVYHSDPLRFVHPWLHDLREVPYGKFSLIASLSWNSAYSNALSEPAEAELIHPYYSEPLMELCLRLPSFVMLHNGWDRALVRRAFERELPEVIRVRTSKGSANLHVRERIERNHTFIRGLLTDGVLVRQGIIDRKKLQDCLPGQATRSTITLARLWTCVAAEAWSRAWLKEPWPATDT